MTLYAGFVFPFVTHLPSLPSLMSRDPQTARTTWTASRKCPVIQISQPHHQFINLQFPYSQSPRILHLESPVSFSPCGKNRIVDDWSRSSYPFQMPALFLYIHTHCWLIRSLPSSTLKASYWSISGCVWANNTPFCNVNTVIDQVISHSVWVPLINM